MSVNALSTSAFQHSHVENAAQLPLPRQIRFVSTDGRPHTKRRRINAACLTCRKRKTRCSGERPECKTCTDNGQPCVGYADGPPRQSTGAGKDDDEDSASSSPRKAPTRSTGDGLLKSNSQPSEDLIFVQSIIPEEAGDMKSPASNNTANSMASARNRVPYFRYFGPTAIVPGFKQMVVQMKDHRRSVNSVAGDSPASTAVGATPSVLAPNLPPMDIPFYDANNPAPNAPLITELCEGFFTHLGCNYPFLQRERFLRDLEDKKVDAILVDAVCAVAARFSSHPLLSSSNDQSIPVGPDFEVKRAFRGHAFAQRAMASLVDTFPCPTIAVAQACLLLAYDEFGTDHDSGLWMYLGTSIRMAQDLGIQKLEGLQLEGRIGPTPKTAKNGLAGKDEEQRRAAQQKGFANTNEDITLADRRASEQERIETFYAIFFLDRAVSSGVGRPVTLRDKDIEISFPYRPDEHEINGWPHPYPPMIRIVHMYGRVADVLNNIKEISQVTPDVLKRLAGMERDLTGIYQGLSPKLHFNATNFQHYVKAEQGTNFILLHFWFHTLIVLLHQPTLLHSFEGRIQQLFPDSRELSMSSAKTIADILAFAELIDVKSFIGNPFTSQPMYIAACAFLAEAAAHASQPPSRCSSPPDRTTTKPQNERRQTAKHTLLATAANQNYHRCYKALKTLDSYWAGCRYILTALDQKSKGLMDPLLFTSDDLDGEMPSTELSFTTPGWRRTTSNTATASMAGHASGTLSAMRTSPNRNWSRDIEHSQAIGWSLTGTTNSPAPNLSFLFQTNNGEVGGKRSPPAEISRKREARHLPVSSHEKYPQNQVGKNQKTEQSFHQSMASPGTKFLATNPINSSVSTAEADLLLGLHSPFTPNSTPSALSGNQNMHTYREPLAPPPQGYGLNTGEGSHPYFEYPNNFGDMLIESQDVDMSDQHGGFTFPGGDMIPWLEYLPQDVLNYFGETPGDGSMMLPSGPGPPNEGYERFDLEV